MNVPALIPRYVPHLNIVLPRLYRRENVTNFIYGFQENQPVVSKQCRLQRKLVAVRQAYPACNTRRRS